MRGKIAFTVVLLLSCAGHAHAAQVTMQNGDRLTGTIEKSDNKTLVLKTDYAGELKLDWKAVSAIVTSEPVNVTLTGGETLRGKLNLSEKGAEMDTPSGGIVYAQTAAVQGIRSDKEEAAFKTQERELHHPRLTDFWSSALDAGMSLTRGNANSVSIAIHGQAARAAESNKLSLYGESIFAKSTSLGVISTTAHAIRGGLRDDFKLRDGVYAFGSSDFEYDQIQLLDFRNVLGAGIGYHAVKSARTVFDVFGGGSFRQDYFSTNVSMKSAQALTGEEWDYKLGTRAVLSERLSVYPNLSDLGQYYATLDSSASTKLNRWMSWHTSFSDRFLSDPISGARKNDLLLTTGLRVTFGKGNL